MFKETDHPRSIHADFVPGSGIQPTFVHSAANQWGPRKKHDKLGIPSIIANFDHPLDVILAARPEVA
jgi:hypothetical protein